MSWANREEIGGIAGENVFRQFGACAIDTSRREVRRDGAAVHLTPKAFDLLVLLIEAAPRVVPKAELHRGLWPGTFVSDATLAGLIKEIRRELRDRDAKSPIIRTAHRVGYAFCPHVDRPAATVGVCHWLVVGDRRVALREGENTIGRDANAQVWLDLASVSRVHASIVIREGGAWIEDRRSKNGTRVGDEAIAGARPLRDGDRLRFGTVSAVYRRSGAGMSTVTHEGSGTHG